MIKELGEKRQPIICDSAEPKSINEFREAGLPALGAKKGPDSIEYGIKFLQSLDEIIIDGKRCPNAAREFSHYETDRDKEGNPIARYPDKNNHTIDAARYAMEQDTNFKKRKNYKKEYVMVIDEEIISAGITPQILSELITRHGNGTQRLEKLMDYYLGRHDILNRKRTSDKISNNRIICNHAKYIVDMTKSYLCRKSHILRLLGRIRHRGT